MEGAGSRTLSKGIAKQQQAREVGDHPRETLREVRPGSCRPVPRRHRVSAGAGVTTGVTALAVAPTSADRWLGSSAVRELARPVVM
jgi:hypothetical protein